MKKEKQKRGEILCRVTREESNSFDRIGNTRRGIMSLIHNLTLTEDDLWRGLREKYKLKKDIRMVIDTDGNVIRKIF